MKEFEYQRIYVDQILERVSVKAHLRVTAITGPRQVGKTTMALQVRRQLIASKIKSIYISMDSIDSHDVDGKDIEIYGGSQPIGDQSNEQILIEIWRRARQHAIESPNGAVLLLDEIHLIPQWSKIVKGLWDADRRKGCPLRVVILGSAAWRMMVGRNESLVGRFELMKVPHWSFREMADVFKLSLDEYIFYGGYPGPFSKEAENISLPDWREYIRGSIIEPINNRDIIGVTRIKKPALMRQLIHLAPSYSGQIISYNKLLAQLDDAGNATTLVAYLDLVSEAGLITALNRYTPAPHQGKASPPKLNVLNSSIMTATTGYTLEEAKKNKIFWGHIVESAVGAHLYNSKATGTEVYFWRDKRGYYEVDFVIERGPHLLGLEVKSGKMRSRSGLDGFKTRFPHAKTMVVGPSGVPFNEFFSLTTEEWIEN